MKFINQIIATHNMSNSDKKKKVFPIVLHQSTVFLKSEGVYSFSISNTDLTLLWDK